MNPTQLAQALRCPVAIAAKWGPHLVAAMQHYDLNTPERSAMFLAQVGHESAGLSRLTENLNYSSQALVTVFGRHRITQHQADQYGRNAQQPADPEAIANTVYGGDWGRKNLGNTQPGDGWQFRGRGAIQTTGRANYAATHKALATMGCPDLITHPDALATPEWAAWSAAWFCGSRPAFLAAADAGDMAAATRIVNGGTHGLDDRTARYGQALEVFA